MNDPSEGRELLKYLNINQANFTPKPFIGSFISSDKSDDLNMWRFYGKEKGFEANGCAIVLRIKDYIEKIKNSLSNEKNKEARLDDESDINIYHVLYVLENPFKFINSNVDDTKIKKINSDLKELKSKVKAYIGNNKDYLNENLNNLSFLFKKEDYQTENEIRLVMSGVEYVKNIDDSSSPPKIYIELEPIKNDVKHIYLGPKVDNASEWASSLYYSYQNRHNQPSIYLSDLPYK
jgi:hypothetical protein